MGYVRRQQALPHKVQPEGIGYIVASLASDEARSVTGAEIPVDAGTLALAISRD